MASPRTIIVGVSVALTAYLAWGVVTADDTTPSAPRQVPIAINGGRAAGHRYTTPSWTIIYDHIEASTDSNFINARGIRDAVIYRNGKPYIHMKADHIEADLASKNFTATGHLRARQTTNGVTRTFETGTASWTEYTQLLQMPNPIRLRTQNISLNVRSLTFDVKAGKVNIGDLEARMHAK